MHPLQPLAHLFAHCQSQNELNFVDRRGITNMKYHFVGNGVTQVIYKVPLLAKWHAWMLLTACLMSPSAMNRRVLKASSVILTFYPSTTLFRLSSTQFSFSLPNLRIMHLLWIGSIILDEVLQLSTNLVVSLKLLIIILRACWAPSVRLSASSRIIILVLPGGRDTFFCAKDFIWSLTTSMPLQSEALSSSEASLNCPSKSCLTIQRTLDVLPTPGGPERMRLGMYP